MTPQHWAYVHGQVAFDTDWGRAAYSAATAAGLTPDEASRISNLVARKQLPTETDVAVGSLVTIRGELRPQIWLSTSDRNHVAQSVHDALMRDQAPLPPTQPTPMTQGTGTVAVGGTESTGANSYPLSNENAPRARVREASDEWMDEHMADMHRRYLDGELDPEQASAHIELLRAWEDDKHDQPEFMRATDYRFKEGDRVNAQIVTHPDARAQLGWEEVIDRPGRVIEVKHDPHGTTYHVQYDDGTLGWTSADSLVPAKTTDMSEFNDRMAAKRIRDGWRKVVRPILYKSVSTVSKKAYQRAVQEHGPVPSHQQPDEDEHLPSRQAAVDPEWWAEWIQDHPYSYHTHRGNATEEILENGLVPYGQLDPYIRDRGYGGIGNHPRWNHAYAAVELGTYNPDDETEYAVFKIDNSKLDPAKIDLDEDFANPNHHYVGIDGLKSQVNVHHDAECPCGKPAAHSHTGNVSRMCNGGVGGWVDNNPHMDEHDQVIRGIQHPRGAFAVRGGIPADAIELVDEHQGCDGDYEHKYDDAYNGSFDVDDVSDLMNLVDELRRGADELTASEDGEYDEKECTVTYDAGRPIKVNDALDFDIIEHIEGGDMEVEELLEVLKGVFILGHGHIGHQSDNTLENGPEVYDNLVKALQQRVGVDPNQQTLFDPDMFKKVNPTTPVTEGGPEDMMRNALAFLLEAPQRIGDIQLPHPYDSDTYGVLHGHKVDTVFASLFHGRPNVEHGQYVEHKDTGTLGRVSDSMYVEGRGWQHTVDWHKHDKYGPTQSAKQLAGLSAMYSDKVDAIKPFEETGWNGYWHLKNKPETDSSLRPVPTYSVGAQVQVWRPDGKPPYEAVITSRGEGDQGMTYGVQLTDPATGETGTGIAYGHEIIGPSGRTASDWRIAMPVSPDGSHHQQVLDANRGRDLDGLPSRPVTVPNVGRMQFGSHGHIQQVAEDYNRKAGIQQQHPTDYMRVSPEISERIADEYERMPHDPHDPKVKAAYDALKRETLAQYQHAVENGYQFDFYPEQDPYANSPREAVLDLHHNKRMFVYPTEDGYGNEGDEYPDHPLLEHTGIEWGGKPVTYNDAFRAVHDFYGHAKEGLGFRADGEDNAWRQHQAMFSPEAQRALTAETRGQNSWVNFGPHGEHNQTATSDTVYAPQKAGILPDWTLDPNLHSTDQSNPGFTDRSTYASAWQEIT